MQSDIGPFQLSLAFSIDGRKHHIDLRRPKFVRYLFPPEVFDMEEVRDVAVNRKAQAPSCPLVIVTSWTHFALRAILANMKMAPVPPESLLLAPRNDALNRTVLLNDHCWTELLVNSSGKLREYTSYISLHTRPNELVDFGVDDRPKRKAHDRASNKENPKRVYENNNRSDGEEADWLVQ